MACNQCEEGGYKRGGHCTPKVLEIKGVPENVMFHTIPVPAALGDDEDNPPIQGAYKNILLVYEANNHAYLYNSDGIFTQISWGRSGSSSNDFNRLDNRPLYDGIAMTSNTNIPNWAQDIEELSDSIDDEEEARINGDAAINTAIDKTVVTDFSVSGTPSTASIVLDGAKQNILTGATSTSSITLPVASSVQAGVMNTSTYNSVQTNAENINALLSGSVAVSGLSPTPTQAQLTAAWQTATGLATIINTAKIFDQTNSKIWTYYSNISAWVESSASGTVTVNTATNTSKGIVQGDANTDGKVFVEANGTMSLNGWDSLIDDVADNMANIASLQTEKVDKVTGKQLSTEDYTTTEKDKLAGIAAGAEVNVQANWTQTTTTADDYIKNKPTSLSQFAYDIMDKIYPVGSIYMSATLSTVAQVASALGGTWEAWGAGRVPVGVDAAQTEFDTVEETGGEKTHTLTVAEMPNHRHSYAMRNYAEPGSEDLAPSTTADQGLDWNGQTNYTGGGESHNNLQPYITCYMYKRIS